MLPIQVAIGISERFKAVEGLTSGSILHHCSAPIDIFYAYPARESGCTGFSNVRHHLASHFKGFVIYLDCDMILLDDIAKLWEFRQRGRTAVLEDGSTEVMIIDCDAPGPHIKSIPLHWNSEDKIETNSKLLHFTDLKCQPWFYDHPNKEAVDVWKQYKLIGEAEHGFGRVTIKN